MLNLFPQTQGLETRPQTLPTDITRGQRMSAHTMSNKEIGAPLGETPI